MLKAISRFSKGCNELYTILACLFLLVVILSTGTQVFTRYILNASQPWTEELARYAFIWTNLLGSAVAVRHGSHAAVSILEGKLKGKTWIVQQVVVYSLMLLCCAILIVFGFRMVSVASKQLSPAMRFPMSLVYLAVPVGAIGIAIQAFERLVLSFQGKGKM